MNDFELALFQRARIDMFGNDSEYENIFKSLIYNNGKVIPHFYREISKVLERNPFSSSRDIEEVISVFSKALNDKIGNVQNGQLIFKILKILPDFKVETITKLDLERIADAPILDKPELWESVDKLKNFYNSLIFLMQSDDYAKDGVYCPLAYLIFVKTIIDPDLSLEIKKKKILNFASVLNELLFVKSIRFSRTLEDPLRAQFFDFKRSQYLLPYMISEENFLIRILKLRDQQFKDTYNILYNKEEEFKLKLDNFFGELESFFLTEEMKTFNERSYKNAFWKSELTRNQVKEDIVNYFTFNKKEKSDKNLPGIADDFLKDIGKYIYSDLLGVDKNELTFYLINSVFIHNMESDELINRLGKGHSNNFKKFMVYLNSKKITQTITI